MIYFLSIFLFVYLIILLFKPSLVFLIYPRVFMIAVSILGIASYNLSFNLIINSILVIYFFMQVLQIWIIYTPKYIDNLKILSPLNSFQKRIDNKFFIIAFSVCTLILISLGGSIDITNPRRFYEFLVNENIQGGNIFASYLWPFLQFLVSDLLTSFSYSLRNLIFTLLLTYFIGSKGLFIGPILTFMQFSFLYKKNVRFKLIFIAITLLIFILPIYIRTLTSFDFVTFFSGYFDHYLNIQKIQDSIEIFPNPKFALASITKFIPGTSRLLNISYVEMYQYYFPYDFSQGKSPGLLMFDDILRVGILIFPFLMIIEAYILRNLLCLYGESFSKIPARILIIQNSIRGSLFVYGFCWITSNLKKIYFKKN